MQRSWPAQVALKSIANAKVSMPMSQTPSCLARVRLALVVLAQSSGANHTTMCRIKHSIGKTDGEGVSLVFVTIAILTRMSYL